MNRVVVPCKLCEKSGHHAMCVGKKRKGENRGGSLTRTRYNVCVANVRTCENVLFCSLRMRKTKGSALYIKKRKKNKINLINFEKLNKGGGGCRNLRRSGRNDGAESQPIYP